MSKTITLKKDDLGQIIVEALHSYTAAGELSNEVDRLMKKLREKAIVRDEFDVGIKIPLTADIDQEKMSEDVRLPDGAKIGHWVMADEVDPKDFEPGPAHILPRATQYAETPTNCTCVGGGGVEGRARYGNEEQPWVDPDGEYWDDDGTNLSNLLRKRVSATPIPEILGDARAYRNMSAERAAFIAWKNGIPLKPDPKDADSDASVSYEEARRREAVARATMLELELAGRQGKLISIEEADRRVAEVREKAPCLSVDLNEVGTYTLAVFANDGVAFIRTPDVDGAQRLKSLLDKG